METLREILVDKGFTVHVTNVDATVLEVARTMSRLRVGSLLVSDDGRPVGIISERDIMTKVVTERRDPETIQVRDVMTRQVVCAAIRTSPDEAMAIMTARRIRHLPVVDQGEVVGLVSIGDLTKWASKSQQHEIQLLNDYVTGRYPG